MVTTNSLRGMPECRAVETFRVYAFRGTGAGGGGVDKDGHRDGTLGAQLGPRQSGVIGMTNLDMVELFFAQISDRRFLRFEQGSKVRFVIVTPEQLHVPACPQTRTQAPRPQGNAWIGGSPSFRAHPSACAGTHEGEASHRRCLVF